MKKILILLIMATALSGCVTIVCNSISRQEKSEVFTDEASKNQAKTITNDGGLL